MSMMEFLGSNIIKSQQGFLVVMAHTEKSSKEFKSYLSQLHGPLMSRNYKVIDIGYRFEEVREIVLQRLKSKAFSKLTVDYILLQRIS